MKNIKLRYVLPLLFLAFNIFSYFNTISMFKTDAEADLGYSFFTFLICFPFSIIFVIISIIINKFTSFQSDLPLAIEFGIYCLLGTIQYYIIARLLEKPIKTIKRVLNERKIIKQFQKENTEIKK